MRDLKVDPAYVNSFIEAENTFLYQVVFDPLERKLRPLNDYPEGYGAEDFPHAGKYESPCTLFRSTLIVRDPKRIILKMIRSRIHFHAKKYVSFFELIHVRIIFQRFEKG